MSKAFTKESDQEQSDPAPILRSALTPGAINYVTPEGAERFRKELAELIAEKQEMTRETPETEDPSSRRRQVRMRQLQQILESAVVTAPPADRARVAFGARVVIRHLNGEEDQYRIVGVDESDPANDQISWQSPLARQLLGKAAGERFRFKFPSGEEELEIRSVEYP